MEEKTMLKKQLADKDKEIQLLREDCNASIKLVREVQEKITRHQVCEKLEGTSKKQQKRENKK